MARKVCDPSAAPAVEVTGGLEVRLTANDLIESRGPGEGWWQVVGSYMRRTTI